MTFATFGVILFAAALHATWNAIVKGGADKQLTTIMVTTWGAVLALGLLPFLEQPAPASWPFLVASTVVHVGYFWLLALNYQVSDMSLAYPVMRGSAPLLVVAVSVLLLHVSLPPLAITGILVICAGVLSMALTPGGGRQGVGLALLNACVIAAYTLIDGEGVRRSESAAGYTLWLYLLLGPVLVGWAFASRGHQFTRYIAANWRMTCIGAVGTVVSYGLALWAMTMVPVAVVSALRETSILFGVLLSATVLHERVSRRRIVAAGIILAGAVALRLS